jgi:hypothetical protein
MAFKDKEKERKYSRDYYHKKMETDPEYRERKNESCRKSRRKKIQTDPEYKDKRRKYHREYEAKKSLIDPGYRLKRNATAAKCNERYIKTVQDILDEFYKDGCGECPEADKDCLHAHHRNPKEKKFLISRANIIKPSREELKKELAKCSPLCANCHMKLHARLRREDGR